MCGRYHFDNDTIKDIERLTGEPLDSSMVLSGDIYPSAEGIVLTGCGFYSSDCSGAQTLDRYAGRKEPEQTAANSLSDNGRRALHAEKMQWGFPGFEKGKLLINAKAETVLEKKTFSDSVLNRRCVIPARWFYEWDRDKNKVLFSCPDSATVYMAGFFDCRDSLNRYVILTTQANESMKKVHDRMPLILSEESLKEWIYNDAKTMDFLQSRPSELKKQQEYEQLSLF